MNGSPGPGLCSDLLILDMEDAARVGATVRIEAPAKLNLFLEVRGKRPDGFHEIDTLMVAVSIYDTLIVTANSGGKIQLDCSWTAGEVARHGGGLIDALGDLPLSADNLVMRAAERLRQASETRAGAAIRIVKRIPAAAGLGGASSDAAAALVALNQAWDLYWPASRLQQVAAEIGSDVPFFIRDPGAGWRPARCRGRGEQIERLAGIPPLHVVVVRPPAGLATAAVYRNCRVPAEPQSADDLIAALRCGDLRTAGRKLFNRLQESAERLSPWISRLRRKFDECDVVGHQMSGSGTSYFGICRHRQHARHVAARLRASTSDEVFCATTNSAL